MSTVKEKAKQSWLAEELVTKAIDKISKSINHGGRLETVWEQVLFERLTITRSLVDNICRNDKALESLADGTLETSMMDMVTAMARALNTLDDVKLRLIHLAVIAHKVLPIGICSIRAFDKYVDKILTTPLHFLVGENDIPLLELADGNTKMFRREMYILESLYPITDALELHNATSKVLLKHDEAPVADTHEVVDDVAAIASEELLGCNMSFTCDSKERLEKLMEHMKQYAEDNDIKFEATLSLL